MLQSTTGRSKNLSYLQDFNTQDFTQYLLDVSMEKNRDGRDEMNLAVLPIALLGRNDERDVIEYYGTFSSAGKKQ